MTKTCADPDASGSLDPSDWEAFRKLALRTALDDAVDFLCSVL